MNPYHMLFSMFYSLSQKIHGRSNGPIFNACLWIAMMIPINVTTIFLFIEFCFQVEIITFLAEITKATVIAFYIGFFLLNYFYFKYIYKAGRIVLFDGYSLNGRYFSASFLAVAYMVGSLVALFVMAALGFNAKNS